MAIQPIGYLKGIKKFLFSFTTGQASGYNAQPVVIFGSDGNPTGGGTPIGSVEAQGTQASGEPYSQNPISIGGLATEDGGIYPLSMTGGALNVNTNVTVNDVGVYGVTPIGAAPANPPVFNAGWDGANIRATYLKLQSASVLTTEYGLVTSSVMRAQHDDTAPSVPVENEFSSLRLSQDRSLLVAQRSVTGNNSSVAGSVAADIVILASNLARKGATIFNDQLSADTTILYVSLGTVCAVNNFTVVIQPGGYYEVPFGYTGQITCTFSAATGSARATELI